MNRLIMTCCIIIVSLHLSGQAEFKLQKNGFIYSSETMCKLETIVDSLNLRYKSCGSNKVYKSMYQSIGHIVKLDSGNIKEAIKDMNNKMSFESFIIKYPKSKVDKNVLILKDKYINHKNEEYAEFRHVSLKDGYGLNIRLINKNDLYYKQLKESWIYESYGKTDYYNESVEAFFFPHEFQSQELDYKYGRQIGYSDCLIDTTSTKFLEDTESLRYDLPENWRQLSKNEKEVLLQKLRSTEVWGSCSMDQGPRIHAMNIALLSAETTNWEVFLKSHLDIMNDNFSRASDGSYAWQTRKTYIKELEELDINVLDLIIGISLRFENSTENHYFGNIGRLGRAISESKNKSQFKSQILSMIEDDNLDDFNRILSYFLFMSCNNHTDNKSESEENLRKLKLSIKALPQYLQDKIELK